LFWGRRKGKRGRAAACKVPVVGIMERDGRFHVSVVPAVSTVTLLKLTVKKVRRGRIVV
jgi:transposase